MKSTHKTFSTLERIADGENRRFNRALRSFAALKFLLPELEKVGTSVALDESTHPQFGIYARTNVQTANDNNVGVHLAFTWNLNTPTLNVKLYLASKVTRTTILEP